MPSKQVVVQLCLSHTMAKELDPYGWMMLAVLVLRQGYGTVPTAELVYTTAITLKMLVSSVQVSFVALSGCLNYACENYIHENAHIETV